MLLKARLTRTKSPRFLKCMITVQGRHEQLNKFFNGSESQSEEMTWVLFGWVIHPQKAGHLNQIKPQVRGKNMRKAEHQWCYMINRYILSSQELWSICLQY